MAAGGVLLAFPHCDQKLYDFLVYAVPDIIAANQPDYFVISHSFKNTVGIRSPH